MALQCTDCNFTKNGVHVRLDWRILIYLQENAVLENFYSAKCRSRIHLCNFIKTNFTTGILWCEFSKVLLSKISENFLQAITAISFVQEVATLPKMNILESLREKCANTEFFLARIFPHSDWIQRDTPYLSIFSPNVGKYGPEKTPYLDTFHAVYSIYS